MMFIQLWSSITQISRLLFSPTIKMQVAGACEYGNESSGSIKCGEFLDQLQNQLASQEGLCSVA